MKQPFFTHLSRAGLLVGIANSSFFILTQTFFIISDTINVVLPLVLILTVIGIYLIFLKILKKNNYLHPKKLTLFLTLVSIPLLMAFPFGLLAINDIGTFIIQQLTFLPLGLAVIGGQALLLWSFRPR